MAGELVVSTINGAGFDGGNVIINPEFTVNQRGAASRTATSSAYNYDRWYYDGTNLLQGVEGTNLRAGTYVISWEGSSTAAYSLNDAAASGQGSESYASVSNGGTITIASVGSNNLWIRFTSDLTNLTKVKLTPGTQASAFVPRPYGTELALCQRYFNSSFIVGTAPANNLSGAALEGVAAAYNTSGTYCSPIFYPAEMRTTPTVTIYSSSTSGVSGQWALYAGSWFAASSTTLTGQTNKYFTAAANSSGLTTGRAYLFNGHYAASAEL